MNAGAHDTEKEHKKPGDFHTRGCLELFPLLSFATATVAGITAAVSTGAFTTIATGVSCAITASLGTTHGASGAFRAPMLPLGWPAISPVFLRPRIRPRAAVVSWPLITVGATSVDGSTLTHFTRPFILPV